MTEIKGCGEGGIRNIEHQREECKPEALMCEKRDTLVVFLFYSVSSAVLVDISERGEKLIQTGINEEGNWARVEFEGKTYYCRPRYLSESISDESTPADTVQTPAG